MLSYCSDLLSVASGAFIGFTLGLIGGGGTILAVPLLIYVVGVASPHMAIGTSAVAVAASAAVNLLAHARARTVEWGHAAVFGLSGITGAAAGAMLGKMMDGRHLLALFGGLMAVIGLANLRLPTPDHSGARRAPANAVGLLPKLIGTGHVVGALAGFFGIGGGFLIVPGLRRATGMPLINAIGSSLVCVTAFGLTTAASYAASELVDWRLALLVIFGGAIGGPLGVFLSFSPNASKR
jgi:uncharacterized membrane protein YfcA